MQANDAIRILGSAAAMGLLGGGSALAYNAVSQPTLDEYGNTIESNDINPFVAALGGAAIGAVGGGIYGHYNQPVAKPMQGMSAGASPQPRQPPDIDIEVVPNAPAFNRQNPRGWNYVDGLNPQEVVQVVPARPMEIQNPMSPPGMKTVVIQQPPKAPGQEMMEEALMVRELAAQQRQQRQVHARAELALEGWSPSQPGWMQTNYPQDRQQNAAGWDVMLPTGKTRRALNEASDEERYQDWLLATARQEAQKKRG